MKTLKIAAIIAIIACFTVPALPESEAEKGTKIMKMNDDQPIFQKVKGDTVIKIYGSTGELRFSKKCVMAAYTENMGTQDQKENYICYFQSPPDDSGNSYLLYNFKNIPDNKYVYLKGIRKAKKVTGADKKLGFFGSDFTNGDIGKPDFTECTYRFIGDASILFRGKPFECWMIESLPKTPDIMRETGYGRKVTYIEKKTLLTLKLEYFDENKIKLKELVTTSFVTRKNVQGKQVYYTTGLEMKNVRKGTRTEMLFLNMKFEDEANITPAIFSVEYLTRKWW